MTPNKPPVVVVRIKGGLGNQLFCYAAARRLALCNNAELIIDDVSGYSYDRKYRRRYMLDPFQISARKATPAERMEPFGRYRRYLAKSVSQWRPFAHRRYIEQRGCDLDERLLRLRFTGKIYLDGYWQSERYFKDVEAQIRKDLEFKVPDDDRNKRIADEIQNVRSVAIHVRWFDAPGVAQNSNVTRGYYLQAISYIEQRIEAPRFFLFSDNPVAAQSMFSPISDHVFTIFHNSGDMSAYRDLRLMTRCQHFIIANSTYSWWGAWLGGEKNSKIVVAPAIDIRGITSWGFSGLIPDEWVLL